ncbi:MAG: hypothetical protein QXI16_07090 [Sulfolobaceae archaeon]
MMSASTDSQALMAGVTDVFSVVNQVFTQITSNWVLTLFLSASVIGLGIGIFRGLRRSV